MRAALARGKRVNQKGAGGCTGLMLAAHKGHEAVVELLLQQPGLDVNLTDGVYHRSALHFSSIEGHSGVVRRLLAHPSQSCHNAVTSEGFSPLMVAVQWNRVECVRELVAVEEVDLEARDLDGYGLEEWARVEGSLEAWQVVREELGRREEQYRTLSMEEMMAKCSGALEKQFKQKKMMLKKAKAEEAKEKRTRAAEAQREKVEQVQKIIEEEAEQKRWLDGALKLFETNSSQTHAEMNVELGKLEALMEEDSGQDRRDTLSVPPAGPGWSTAPAAGRPSWAGPEAWSSLSWHGAGI